MNTSLSSLIRNYSLDLQQIGIENPAFDLKLMLAHLLDCELGELYSHSSLSQDQYQQFLHMIELRKQHCPVDKIIGHKGFYKFEFETNSNVLSPRPDTEIIVEQALNVMQPMVQPKILEFGIGSGCILLSLLADRLDAFGIGIDISKEALEVALKNAKNLGVTSRTKLFHADWRKKDDILSFQDLINVDLIVSNPPYIPSNTIALLDQEVKDYDPLIALDGGIDGLRDYRYISDIASSLLKKDGFLIFEIGENQEKDVVEIAETFHFKLKFIVKDLNQINRCIILQK